jgi:hypothetical protein
MPNVSKRTSNDDKISTSFKIPKSLHVELKIAAAKEDREMGEIVEDALRAYFKSRSSR